MKKIKVALHGLGNIAAKVIECVEQSPDMEALGVIRRQESLGKSPLTLRGLPDFASLDDLIKAQGRPEVIILCGPSRLVPEEAARLAAAGVATVDSYDIHQGIPEYWAAQDQAAKKAGTVSVIAAGWDPGTDSVLRAVFEAMTPVGITFTNFGRGRSMGHSVAARGAQGVSDAISLTIPLGGGRHARHVFVLPKPGAAAAEIEAALKADPYFAHDPLTVTMVKTPEELAAVADNSHGVLMERVGASGLSSNQRLTFDMRIDNPALTAQILTSSARAATRLAPGAYTLIDVPPVAFLPGDRLNHVARLV